MTENTVTLSGCRECPVTAYCDAHITGGQWHHRQGEVPCRVVLS